MYNPQQHLIMEKEQKRIDLISSEVEELLVKWHDEAPEKRAVIVIAYEDEGEGHHIENLINGKGVNLIGALHSTFSDTSKENKLASLMRKAMMIYNLESACNSLENISNILEARLKAKKSEETKEEEGEQ